ncbi:MAG: S1 RNA-binding domain-containing protein [Synechococcaceae cyanobacterium SM2_3_1]|nr:S1 RNA-binding domain-containing protein [Synechococcaceae cyanobacterium SM2_3_1]
MNAKVPRRSQTAVSSFSMDDFAQALEEHYIPFQAGQVVRGRIFEHDSRGVYVDIGAKSPALLPLREVAPYEVNNREDLETLLPLHSEAEFLIIREQNLDGQVMLSRRRLLAKIVWEQLAQQQEDNQTLDVRVTGLNKGGVLVDVQGLRGFIPRSHLNVGDDLKRLVGQVLTAGLLEVNPEKNKLVLSQRMVTQASSVREFAVGQVVEGLIRGIKPFGLFVDLDGTSALLHIKQISQKFIHSLEESFHLNQPLKAVILDLDPQKGRISLSTRVLEKYPGEILENLPQVMEEAEERARKYQSKLAEAQML